MGIEKTRSNLLDRMDEMELELDRLYKERKDKDCNDCTLSWDEYEILNKMRGFLEAVQIVDDYFKDVSISTYYLGISIGAPPNKFCRKGSFINKNYHNRVTEIDVPIFERPKPKKSKTDKD